MDGYYTQNDTDTGKTAYELIVKARYFLVVDFLE